MGRIMSLKAFDAMMTMGKIDVARIEATVKGETAPTGVNVDLSRLKLD